ncbi:MAG: tripartite tricarboxylate transporter TctB family protein [Syntrophorhabdales bacterium]
MRSYNLISSSFWFLIGLGFATGGLRYGFGTWREPGPGLLPVVFGTLLAVLSLVLFIVSFIARGKPQEKTFWERKGSWKTVLAVSLSLVGYMVLFNQLGFIFITFLFLFFLLKFIGKKGWLISISVALVLSFFCHGIFSLLLGTPLPKGRIYGTTFRTPARV